MLSDIKYLIFDLGGVICDLKMERVREAFREIGMPRMAAMMDPCYPAEINERMESGRLSWEEACNEMRQLDNVPEVTNEQIAWVYREFLAAVAPEKMALIDKLRAKGYKTYVLSNTNPVAFEIVRDRVREATGREIESYFDGIYLSYRLRVLKPKAEIFQKMIAESGVKPSQTLFIDDGQRNADAGREAGFNIYCPPTNGEWMHIFEENIE